MRCNYCEFRCNLEGERYGVCRMYKEQDGKIIERFPNMWVTTVSRMESLPLYHIYPGSRAFSVGTAGCNFKCRYCSNSFIAKENPEDVLNRLEELLPDKFITEAKKQKCESIVFNVNEPTVSLQTIERISPVAREAGLPMGCLTNAYFTEETGELMTSLFSFFNVGLKGLSSDFCIDYLGIPNSEPVLRNIDMLGRRRHIEVVTPVIQGVNDGELKDMADFISGIDKTIPWHIFRLLPESDMKSESYPNIDAVNRLLEPVRQQLDYVYFHNFVGSDWVNTLCPECGAVAVERFSMGCGGDLLKNVFCENGKCPKCGSVIKMISKDEFIETGNVLQEAGV